MDTMENRKESAINNNLRQIQRFLKSLSPAEKDKTLARMSDIFIFYNISFKKFERILEMGVVPHSASKENLAVLEGITNAMLFRLKYQKIYLNETNRSKESL